LDQDLSQAYLGETGSGSQDDSFQEQKPREGEKDCGKKKSEKNSKVVQRTLIGGSRELEWGGGGFIWDWKEKVSLPGRKNGAEGHSHEAQCWPLRGSAKKLNKVAARWSSGRDSVGETIVGCYENVTTPVPGDLILKLRGPVYHVPVRDVK